MKEIEQKVVIQDPYGETLYSTTRTVHEIENIGHYKTGRVDIKGSEYKITQTHNDRVWYGSVNIPIWGGKREGAGRPIVHSDPEVRERTKKFRATDREWEEFLDLLPDDSREAFEYIFHCAWTGKMDIEGRW